MSFVHLLTREALAGYLAHRTPGGVLVLHISNRHMELARVVAAMGAAEGLRDLREAGSQARRRAERFQDECSGGGACAQPERPG